MHAARRVHPHQLHAGAPPRAARRRALRAAVLAVVAVALATAALAAVSSPAQAAPQDTIMTLPRLQALLAASPTGTVPGYFLTTDKGAHIATIDCTVEGVVPEAADDLGSLVMFDATGDPIIDSIGGIAEGMSGSPLYVYDPATKTNDLAAAVSYGAEFTKGGLGLATPIEHMMALEPTASPTDVTATRSVSLKRPLSVDGAAVSTMVVAATDAAAQTAHAAGHALVMRPLSVLTVSGLPGASPLFKMLDKVLSAKGIQVRAGADDQGAAGTEPDFTTALVPGSAVGDFFGWGDYSYGGMGTTTYTTAGDTLVAFGHPMLYDGAQSSFLTNVDTIGMWGSLDAPYKMLAPGKIRGAITLDSGAGILGAVDDDAIPTKVPLISTATNDATGTTVTNTTYVTPYAIGQVKDPFPELNASAFYPAMFQAVGDEYYDGHLDYRLTVDVTDGTHSYQIVKNNQWEDTTGWDAAFFAASDIFTILNELNTDPDGTIGAHITAITLVSHLSPQHVRARIADVTIDRSLKTGSNAVHVSLYPYGSTTPVTRNVKLVIPKGMALNGSLFAVAPDLGLDNFGGGGFFMEMGSGGPYGAPETLGDVVADIDGQYANNDLLVVYDPQQGYGLDEYYNSGMPWSAKATAPVVSDLGEFLTGGAEKSVATLNLRAMPSHIKAGSPAFAGGDLEGNWVDDDAVQTSPTVQIFERPAGRTTDKLVGSVPLTDQGPNDESDSNQYLYSAFVPPLLHNATITAVWAGDANNLTASASTTVSVSPRVAFAVSRKAGGALRLSASVAPAGAGVMVFARVGQHGRLSPLKVVKEKHGRAVMSWNAPAGTYRLKVVVRRTSLNAAGASKTITVTVP